MKKTTQGTRAHELELIISVGGLVNRRLYVLDGERGLWQRVPRSKKNEQPRENIVAFLHGGLAEFRRAKGIEDELVLAGCMEPIPEPEPEADEATNQDNSLTNGGADHVGDDASNTAADLLESAVTSVIAPAEVKECF